MHPLQGTEVKEVHTLRMVDMLDYSPQRQLNCDDLCVVCHPMCGMLGSRVAFLSQQAFEL
jgi:hypothetical protein